MPFGRLPVIVFFTCLCLLVPLASMAQEAVFIIRHTEQAGWGGSTANGHRPSTCCTATQRLQRRRHPCHLHERGSADDSDRATTGEGVGDRQPDRAATRDRGTCEAACRRAHPGSCAYRQPFADHPGVAQGTGTHSRGFDRPGPVWQCVSGPSATGNAAGGRAISLLEVRGPNRPYDSALDAGRERMNDPGRSRHRLAAREQTTGQASRSIKIKRATATPDNQRPLLQ